MIKGFFIQAILACMAMTALASPVNSVASAKEIGRGASSLPYDSEVEYIESTGTQWIDTAHVPTIGDSIAMRFMLAKTTLGQYEQIMGAGTGTYQIAFPAGIYNGQLGCWCRIFGGGSGYASLFLPSSSVGLNVITDFRCEYISDKRYRMSAGSATITQTAISELDGNANQKHLLIFRRPAVGNARMKCYLFQVVNAGGVLVCDFIPVRFTNEQGQPEGAMYDRANPTGGMNPDGSPRTDGLYRNRGTGAFLIGPDKR